MNIHAFVAAEHSQRQCLKIADYVGNNAVRFKQLVEVFLQGPYRITQRAAWPLTVCVERHPGLISPHLPMLIKMLARTDVHDAVKRNILRSLQFIEVPNKFHGKILDISFQLLTNPKEPVAVRVFAMTVIYNILKMRDMPDVENELRIILEDQLPYATAGFRSRGVKILAAMSRQTRTKTISR